MSSRNLHRSALMGLALFGSAGAADAVAQNQASLRIDDVSVLETGIGRATFTVRLLGTHGPVSVSYSTSGGTATAGSQCGGATRDFIGMSSLLIFGATDSVRQIDITVCNDTRDEPDETFFVNLSNASGATIQDGVGVGTIGDDDPPPSLSIDDVTVTEGPVVRFATFTVSLSAASSNSVTVSFVTRDGTARGGTCLAGGFDYRANPSPLTIAPDQASGTLAITICDDGIREGNESFGVKLLSATNATIQDGTGLGTITDDEPLPALSIVAAVQTAESANAAFTVTLSGPPTAQTVSVNFATRPGSASAGNSCLVNVPPLVPGDYVTQTGTLSFAPGVTTQQIPVPICSDRVSDPNETFTVQLSIPVNATFANATGTATIR